MTVEFFQTRVHMKLVEADDRPGLGPGSFVVADFDEPFIGRPDLAGSRDSHSMSWGRVPLRYVDQDVDVLYESGGVETADYLRAHAARALLALFDDLEVCSGSCVPTGVAIHSQSRPCVAMYLFAYQGLTREEIADLFDVESETVRRYRRRVQNLGRQSASPPR